MRVQRAALSTELSRLDALNSHALYCSACSAAAIVAV